MDDIAGLRQGVRTNCGAALRDAAASAWVPPGEGAADVSDEAIADAATRLELEVYKDAFPRNFKGFTATECRMFTIGYVNILRRVTTALRLQTGAFPDEVVAVAYLRGALAPAAVLRLGMAPPDPPDPRETIRRLFVRALLDASPAFRADRPRALRTAAAIELSCFNEVVRVSKTSEDPPRRQWDSPAFVDIYSGRCGAVYSLMDPGSSSCLAYGEVVVPRLLDGTLAPGDLGRMSERALCPAATAEEQRTIRERSDQRIKEKVSTLFKCPHAGCGARSSTYQEVQTRGPDEAPDYFCHCHGCGRRFKGYA